MKNQANNSAVFDELRQVNNDMAEIMSTLFRWGWVDTTGGSFSTRMCSLPGHFALTPTHSGFGRWQLDDGLVVLDDQCRLSPQSTSTHLAHPSAIVHARIYSDFPLANAVLHTHSPYSLAFACRKDAIEPLTLHSQILGSVPCLCSDADDITSRSTTYLGEIEEQITSGIVGYRYAHKHFSAFLPELTKLFVPRRDELARHGLAFTVYKHGIFVIARNLNEAFDNLIRVERNAQVQLMIN